MKLQLCGSSGTGKSTLAKLLAEKYDLSVLLNSTRKVDVKYRLQYLGQCAVFVNFQMMLNGNEDYVSDRSLIDVLAYSSAFEAWDDDMLGSLLTFINMPQFAPDLLIYTPIEFPMEPHLERGLITEEKRIAVDDFVKLTAFSKAVFPQDKVLTVTGSVEERMAQIDKRLKSMSLA